MTGCSALALVAPALAVVLASCGATPGVTHRHAAAGQIGVVRFARALDGPVVPGPVLAADGSLLAASAAGDLHALNPATGRDRWRFDGNGSYGSDLSTSPLQLPDGTILWPGPRDRLFALSAAGRLAWSVDLGATGLTPARGRDGTIYEQDTAGTLHAIDASARTGHERWTLRTGSGASYGSAAVGRDGTIYTTVGHELVAIRDHGSRGVVAWRFAARADIEVSPVVAPDGTVVLGTNDRYEYGIGPGGHERWRWRREVFTYSSPVATPDGLVRFGDHRGRLITLVAATGAVKRIDRGHGQVWGAPAVDAHGGVAFAGHPGEVFVINRSGLRTLHLTLGGPIDSSPAFGPDGTLYIGSENGRLYALEPANGPA